MIQFNLLPDVKQQYISARKKKQQIIAISIIVAGSSLGILVILFLGVNVWQKHVMTTNKSTIAKDIQQLKDVKDLDKILTVQSQLGEIDGLHNTKPATSRVFTYLPQITPSNVTIANLNIDYTKSGMTIVGSADSLVTVNKFVDTLKFTTYSVDSSQESKPAFKNVVLSAFSVGTADPKSPNKTASYQISLTFDPVIFDVTKQVTLSVPANKVTTQSELGKPSVLFDALNNNQQ